MNALPRHLQAPALGFPTQVSQPVKIAALEETLPDVGHAALHLGLVLGMTDPGRVGDEAAMLGVLQKASGQSGMLRLLQFRFLMNRRNDGYDTVHPRASNNSWTRVTFIRSPVSHW